MKQTARGILIHRQAQSETSLMVTLLTEKEGLVTYLFQGAKKKRGLVLFPLAPVEFSFYRRTDSALGKITELNLTESVLELPVDPIKSSIAFFIVELIQRTLKPGHAEPEIVRFLTEEAVWINHSTELTNYPAWFLANYTKFLGIVPSVDDLQPTVLDLVGGRLSTIRPNHARYLEGNWMHWMESMLNQEKIHFLAQSISKEERNCCIDAWINYYQHHLNGMSTLKSLEVIRTVFNG